MSRAIRSRRPRGLIRIRNCQQHGGLFIEQLQGVGRFQAAGVRPEDPGKPIHGLHVGRRGRHHQERAAGQLGVRRKRVTQIAAHQPIAADVLEPRVRIVKFDELQILQIGARRRLVHDLGNDNGRGPGRGAEWFVRTRLSGDDAAGDVHLIAELSRRGLGGIVAADDEAHIELAGQGEIDAAEQAPGLAVVARITVENIADALEAQIGVGIIGGEIPARSACAPRHGAGLEERAIHGRGR